MHVIEQTLRYYYCFVDVNIFLKTNHFICDQMEFSKAGKNI